MAPDSANPAPPILEYASFRRSRRHAVGGLTLLGLAFVGMGTRGCVLTLVGVHASGGPHARDWIPVGISALLGAWGTGCCVCAFFMSRNSPIAAWIAIVLVSINTLAVGGLFTAGVVMAWRWDRVHAFVLLGLGPLVILGFVAVIVETIRVLKAVRDPMLL